jgi:hypothetical protein
VNPREKRDIQISGFGRRKGTNWKYCSASLNCMNRFVGKDHLENMHMDEIIPLEQALTFWETTKTRLGTPQCTFKIDNSIIRQYGITYYIEKHSEDKPTD